MGGDDSGLSAETPDGPGLRDAPAWAERLRDAVLVVKFGGNAMVDDGLTRAFAEDMIVLRQQGVRVAVVHGGGPQISAELKRRGIRSEFRGGLRVTSPEAFEVVRDVLTLGVGHGLAEAINARAGARREPLAQSLSGETDGLFLAARRGAVVGGEPVDLGLVGDVVEVDPAAVLALIDAGRIPVVSSIAPDRDTPGQSLNVNADSAAAALAIALAAERLIVLTDVAGLYRDWPNRDSLVSRIATNELAALLPSLESGMIPKMTACLDAVLGGVSSAAVIDGRVPHSILLEVSSESATGTEVVGAVPSPQVKAVK